MVTSVRNEKNNIMVKALKGTIVKCDPAMKQLLLFLNDEEKFIIEDLDETHVLIDRSYVSKLKTRFKAALEENIFSTKDGTEVKSTW